MESGTWEGISTPRGEAYVRGSGACKKRGPAAQSLAAERGRDLRKMGDSKSPMGPESKFLPEG